jgi:hypothetical protein
MDDNYRIETIETMQQLQNIKEDWKKIFNSRKTNSIFCSFEVFNIYYNTITKYFKKVQIKIFIIRNKTQKIVAIFPFTSEVKLYHNFLPIRELSIKDFFLIGVHNFLIDEDENYQMIFRIFIEKLRKNKTAWDVLRLYRIPENEQFFPMWESLCNHQFKTEKFETEHVIIECNTEFQEYIKINMDSKYRRELGRKIRRLEETGKLKFIIHQNEQEIEKTIDNFYDIEDKNWKGNEGSSLKRSYLGEFYKKIARQLSKEDKLRLYFLEFNGTYIAGVYAIIDRETCYLIKTGYDEEFSRFSVSSILFYMLFQYLFEEKKIKKIDFYGPYYSYEKYFGQQTRKSYEFVAFNKKILLNIYYPIRKRVLKSVYK